MADNSTLPATGDVIAADDIGGVKYQRTKVTYGDDGSATDASNTNPFPVSLRTLNFPVSTNNSSTAQLASGASFTGTIESVLNQQAAQITVVCDQAYTVQVKQYIDAAGTKLISTDTFTRSAGQALNENVTLPGNYFNLVVTNNGGSTTTTLTIDVTFGIMDTQPRALTNQGYFPVETFNGALVAASYNVAGVIPINTDLIVLDCLQYRSLYIQCTSMGTTGTVTVQWANDAAFTLPVTATMVSESGVTSTSFNAVALRAVNVMARYCRLRLTVATTGGTTTINVFGSQNPYTPIITTQPVSGSVTVSGSLTSAGTTTATPATPTASILNSAASTNGTVAKASAGTIYGVALTNNGAAAAYFKLHNSTTVTVGTTAVALWILIPAGQSVYQEWGPLGIRYGTGICYSITGAVGDTDTTAVAAGQVKVNLSFI